MLASSARRRKERRKERKRTDYAIRCPRVLARKNQLRDIFWPKTSKRPSLRSRRGLTCRFIESRNSSVSCWLQLWSQTHQSPCTQSLCVIGATLNFRKLTFSSSKNLLEVNERGKKCHPAPKSYLFDSQPGGANFCAKTAPGAMWRAPRTTSYSLTRC